MNKNENKLPPHRSWVKLGDILESLETGKRPKGGVKNISAGIPSIGGEHLSSDGTFDFSNIRYVPEEFAESMNRGWIKNEDIIVVKDGATTAKTSFVSKNFPFKKAVINEHVFICRVKKEINPRWVFFNLGSEEGRKKILLDFRGAAQGGISSNFINKAYIPLPPLAEQKKIVEKIEELFSQLDSGVAALKKAKEQLRLYRQSVLAAAFSGRLNQDLSDSRIKKIDEKNKSGKFKNPLNPNSENLNPVNPTILINHGSDNLPSGWKWVKFGEISLKITDGEHLRPEVQNKGIPFLSAKDVRENDVSFESALYVSENDAEKFWKKCNPEKGDILIVSRGATVGRLCVIKTDKRFCLLGSVILIKVDKQVNSSFIAYLIKSPKLNKQIINVSGSTAQQAIYIRDIKNVKVPLPPLQIQLQIVSEIEKRFSEADNLEKAIDESLAKAETLWQSILSKAFSGKLIR